MYYFFLATVVVLLAAAENADLISKPPTPSSPLPPSFVDHSSSLPDPPEQSSSSSSHVPVHKEKVIGLLLGRGGDIDDCDHHTALANLQSTAVERLKSRSKVERFVRAVNEKLNATCDQIHHLATELKQSPSDHHADRLRRAAEDAAVLSSPAAAVPQQQGAPGVFGVHPPFLPVFGGAARGPSPPMFRFGAGGGAAQSPFFTAPMDSPALEVDLDRLLFMATPSLGIQKAFSLTKAMALLHSPRSEVFSLQERFQKNVTEPEAQELLNEYEQKLEARGPAAAHPTSILQNTAQLSGLNSTESHRFARAISDTIGPLNSTQAFQIHKAIRDSGLNKTELVGVTNEIEKLQEGTTTPEGATGHDWIFSGTKAARAVGSPPSSTRLFTSSKACGFAIQTHAGVIYPWMATVSCRSHLCTGTLVSPSTIIASADFVRDCENEPVKVTLGDARVVNPIEVYAESYVIHPQYQRDGDSAHDVALLYLPSPIDLNQNPMLNPICLVYHETNDPDIECHAIMCNGAGVAPSDQPVSTTPVQCYQPETQTCRGNGLLRSSSCVSLRQCIPIHTQKATPVVCHRHSNPLRYYLWAVSIPDHSPKQCFNGVARVSDCAEFIQSGIK